MNNAQFFLVIGLLLTLISTIRTVLQRLADAEADDIDEVTAGIPQIEVDIPLPMPTVAAPPPVTTTAQITPEPASDMQKILTSVFSDEESTSRRKALYDSVEPVNINLLAELARNTAARLGVKAKVQP